MTSCFTPYLLGEEMPLTTKIMGLFDYKNHGPIWAVNVLRKQLNFKLLYKV